MEKLLRYQPHFRDDPLFTDQFVSAGRCHTAIVNPEPQPFTRDTVSVWLDGEFYNQRQLQQQFKINWNSDPAMLLELYRSHDLTSFLPMVDGIFSGVIYDRTRQLLFLINDRYGLRHLYVSHNFDSIGWSSELKGLTSVPWFTAYIDCDALEQFLRFGYFIEDRTWFSCVKLLPPASTMRFSLTDGAVQQNTYWSWGRIKPMTGAMDIHGIGHEWGRRFRAAVEKRCRKGERVGLTLSGGLDSRAILAAFPEYCNQVQTATFGTPECADIRLAAKASAIRNACHHIYELNSQNWLKPRLTGVWSTDGQLNIIDMHGVEFLPQMIKDFTISLNGLGGDGIHGGSFLSMTKEQAVTTADPYGYRGRRYIRVGTMLDEPWMHLRFPFYDNELIELTTSLPFAMRKNSYFYRRALLESFPTYFQTIPWQKIGVPISMPGPVIAASKVFIHLRNRVVRQLQGWGVPLENSHQYTDYASWLRMEPAAGFFRRLFYSSNAIFPSYINAEIVDKTWRAHMSGTDRSRTIGLYATIELWLQQLLNKAMRPDPLTGEVDVF